MEKLLVFTDLHICAPGGRIAGLDPSARLSAALDHALSRHGDAAALLLLGDLTHHGEAAEYAELARCLAPCPLPIHATLGNHDEPDAFARALPGQMTGGFAQKALDFGETRVLMLDTLDRDGHAPRHGGWLCPARLAWLDAELEAAGGRTLLVACHHPAFDTGLYGMDAIGLQNRGALMDRLARYPGAVQILSGHVHRWISGSARGVGYTVLKSTCHQMPLVLGAASSGLSTAEPGGYGLALLSEAGVILHAVEVAPDPATWDDDHSA